MVSIKATNDDNNNQVVVALKMQGEFSELITEIVIGAVAATRRACGDKVSYRNAIKILCIAICTIDGDLEEVLHV